MKTLDCATVRHLLGEGIDIAHNSDRCKALRAHLSGCAECRAYLNALEKTIDCYRSYTVDVPENAEVLLEEAWNLLKQEQK